MRHLVTLVFFFISLGLIGQARMNSSEVGYIYDLEHEFLIDHRIASSGNQHKVFIKFGLNSGNVKITDYLITYDTRSNYMAEKAPNAEIRLDSSHIAYTGYREFVFAFELETSANEGLIVVDFYNIPKNRRYKYDIPIVKDDIRPNSFLLFESELDIPYFASYLNTNETVGSKTFSKRPVHTN